MARDDTGGNERAVEGLRERRKAEHINDGQGQPSHLREASLPKHPKTGAPRPQPVLKQPKGTNGSGKRPPAVTSVTPCLRLDFSSSNEQKVAPYSRLIPCRIAILLSLKGSTTRHAKGCALPKVAIDEMGCISVTGCCQRRHGHRHGH